MLCVSRKFGESLLIGSVRLTFVGWRKKIAEIMVIRGAVISFVHVPEHDLYFFQIDGTQVSLSWHRKFTCGGSHLSIAVEAPRHIKIYRSELLAPDAAATA
jgi:sRNA-binding carbon storage regulator CsrA